MTSSADNQKSDIYDIAIIGGGVNGCGIARDAAGRGLSVLLLEADDLANATSSASSKLVHGGLRYLEQYEFLLVRKALKERETLLSIAPHIVTPLRIILPHNGELRPKWMIRMGLFLYDFLAGRKVLQKSKQFNLRDDIAGKVLKSEYRDAFEFSDCRVDDARLVVLNAMDARAHGAKVLTRTELTKAHRKQNTWSLSTSDESGNAAETYQARILINAAGPWVSKIISDRIMLDAKSDVRLVKGSHIVVPKLFDHDRAFMFQNGDNRIIFAIPYQKDFTLIGTTDVDITGKPDETGASDEEVQYLCDAINEYFEKPISSDDVVWKFAGTRPLFDDGEQSAQQITRDYVLEMLGPESAPPLLSVFGGKITTYRKLSEAVLDKLAHWLPHLKPAWTGTVALPGGDFSAADRDHLIDKLHANFAFLPRETLARLFSSYGTKAELILSGRKNKKELGICFGADLYQCEVEYLMKNEWAVRANDVVWRRSKSGLYMTAREIRALDNWMLDNKLEKAE